MNSIPFRSQDLQHPAGVTTSTLRHVQIADSNDRPPTPMASNSEDALAAATYHTHQSMKRRGSRFCPDGEANDWLATQPDHAPYSQLNPRLSSNPWHDAAPSCPVHASDPLTARSAPLSPATSTGSRKSEPGSKVKHVTTFDVSHTDRPPTPLNTTGDEAAALSSYQKHQSVRRRASRFASEAESVAFLSEVEGDFTQACLHTADDIPSMVHGTHPFMLRSLDGRSDVKQSGGKSRAPSRRPTGELVMDSLERLLLDSKQNQSPLPPPLPCTSPSAAQGSLFGLLPALHCTSHRHTDDADSLATRGSILSPGSPSLGSVTSRNLSPARMLDPGSPSTRARYGRFMSRELDELAASESGTRTPPRSQECLSRSTTGGPRTSGGGGRTMQSSGYGHDSLSDFMNNTRL